MACANALPLDLLLKAFGYIVTPFVTYAQGVVDAPARFGDLEFVWMTNVIAFKQLAMETNMWIPWDRSIEEQIERRIAEDLKKCARMDLLLKTEPHGVVRLVWPCTETQTEKLIKTLENHSKNVHLLMKQYNFRFYR